MKIIIVGAGVVGEELCAELSASDNDVILIEKDIEKIERLIEKYDITGLVGNGASHENLIEAGIEKADMFISVTESDELNIMACVIGGKLGAKYTIARVRNPEYSTNVKFVREELGISLMINPEDEAAKSIVKKLKFPNAISADTFFSNRANIIGLIVKEESVLVGMTLREMNRTIKGKVIVCAVKRYDKVFIPTGDYKFKENDNIYITGTNESVTDFYNKMGYKTKPVNSVMILGGGIIPHYLTEKLLKNKKSVKIIESRNKRVESLSRKYDQAIVIKGKESDQEFLLNQGIKKYDAVVALTDSDEENIVISMFAKSLNKGKILTKLSGTMLLPILEEQGFSTIVPKKIIAEIILRVVRSKMNVKSSKMNALRRLFNTNAESIIFQIEEGSKIIGIPLKELKIKENLLIASILRNNEELIYPGGDDVLQAKDKVMIITLKAHIEEIDDILK